MLFHKLLRHADVVEENRCLNHASIFLNITTTQHAVVELSDIFCQEQMKSSYNNNQ